MCRQLPPLANCYYLWLCLAHFVFCLAVIFLSPSVSRSKSVVSTFGSSWTAYHVLHSFRDVMLHEWARLWWSSSTGGHNCFFVAADTAHTNTHSVNILTDLSSSDLLLWRACLLADANSTPFLCLSVTGIDCVFLCRRLPSFGLFVPKGCLYFYPSSSFSIDRRIRFHVWLATSDLCCLYLCLIWIERLPPTLASARCVIKKCSRLLLVCWWVFACWPSYNRLFTESPCAACVSFSISCWNWFYSSINSI